MTDHWALAQTSKATIEALSEAVGHAGLEVTLSFDLQSARRALADPASCPCPYHGTVHCTCQYAVLLISAPGRSPVSLVVHGHDGQTSLALTASADGADDPGTVARVRAIVAGYSHGGSRLIRVTGNS